MPDNPSLGVHSEVGRLRKVLVCAPGLAHRRLTPTNADDLLFDDVMWVEMAQRDHADFVNKLRGRGVEVVELHDLLAETVGIPQARDWLLDRKIVANEVGIGLLDDTRAFLESLQPRELADFLIGGLATTDLPEDFRSGYVALARESTGVREYLMPPLPNTLYTRDTTCWLYGGVTLNPLYWPARHDETLLMKAIYQFHPDFTGATVWWGDPEQNWGLSTFEGGDVMPIGNGVVLVGMSERTSRQAITQVAAALFTADAAERVVVAGMPKLRSAMHLDTVFTFTDRDIVTLYPTIVDAIHTFSLRPGDRAPGVEVVDKGDRSFVDVVAESLNLKQLRVIETGGDVYASERHEQVAARTRRKETIIAGIATAYTLFLFEAAGLKFLLLSSVLLAPATLLYVKARSERGRRLFTPTEIVLCVLIVAAGITGFVGLWTGFIHI
jgi:arginine deiminase